MDSIIRKNAHNGSLVHYTDFEKLTKRIDRWSSFDKLYFFFDSELALENTYDPNVYSQMKKDSIRHLIPNKGRYYDYVAHKEYKTLKEWAEDNGKNVSNILYGLHNVYSVHSGARLISAHITLNTLIKFLDPNYEGETQVEVTDKDKLLAQFDWLIKQMNAVRNQIETMK
jgi:hypothetical protein